MSDAKLYFFSEKRKKKSIFLFFMNNFARVRCFGVVHMTSSVSSVSSLLKSASCILSVSLMASS